MLNETYILVDSIAGSTAWQSAFLPQRARLAYRISPDDRSSIDQWVKHCYEDGLTQPFCLCLPASDLVGTVDLSELTILLVHPRYTRRFNQLTLLVEGDNDEFTSRFISQVRDWLEEQGYENAEIILLNKIPARQNTCLFQRINKTDVLRSEIVQDNAARYYGCYLRTAFNYNDIFIVSENHWMLAGEVVQLLEKSLDDTRQQHPYEIGLISALAEQADRYAQDRAASFLAERELKAMKELMKLKAANNEMDKVLTFYHTEYEALPLWYKRFGHIVKVITGKRKLKSLFSDDPK